MPAKVITPVLVCGTLKRFDLANGIALTVESTVRKMKHPKGGHSL
jgi:hypothetical protein